MLRCEKHNWEFRAYKERTGSERKSLQNVHTWFAIAQAPRFTYLRLLGFSFLFHFIFVYRLHLFQIRFLYLSPYQVSHAQPHRFLLSSSNSKLKNMLLWPLYYFFADASGRAV
jgi:hypothetical protein